MSQQLRLERKLEQARRGMVRNIRISCQCSPMRAHHRRRCRRWAGIMDRIEDRMDALEAGSHYHGWAAIPAIPNALGGEGIKWGD